MLIECLIERDGPTHVTLDKFDYRFEARENCGGAAVCDVTNDSHANRFLSMPKCYRLYKGPKPTESPDPKPLPGQEPETNAADDEGQTGEEIADSGEEETSTDDDEGELEMTDAERDEAVLKMHGEGLSYAQIAELVGKSKSWVANRVKILKERQG